MVHCTDTFIQKTKKLFQDTRSQRNLAMLNDDLAEVHSIMTRNIQEVLGQGEKLDSKWWPSFLCAALAAMHGVGCSVACPGVQACLQPHDVHGGWCASRGQPVRSCPLGTFIYMQA